MMFIKELKEIIELFGGKEVITLLYHKGFVARTKVFKTLGFVNGVFRI